MRFATLLVFIVSVCPPPPALAEPTALPHRSWQFQDNDWSYLQEQIPYAKRNGATRIQLSHNIVMDAEELWERPGHEEKLALVRKATRLAHENGLKVDMWTHELSGVPEGQFRDPQTGKVVLSPALWQWVNAKYEKLFGLVPELDGLVLTFAETDHRVYRDDVISDQTPQENIARLIHVMADVCARHDKVLIVRTFVYEPQEIDFLREALTAVARATSKLHNVIVMTKCVPHDWSPYYPYNPILGDVAGLPQIVEIDLGQEFTGQSRILHCEVDYVKRVLDYARSKGVIGAVARVERYENHAIGTPNDVNIHAFSRLTQGPDVSVTQLWREWAVKRYGEPAAPHVIRALQRTFDITNLTLFPLEYWIANHTRLPDWDYALSHLEMRTNRKWIPSPKQGRARDMLLQPTMDVLTSIDAEKDLAATFAEQSLADVDKAKPYLSEADFNELRRYLEFGRDNVEVFRHHNLALFSASAVVQAPNRTDLTPEEVAALRTMALEQARALQQWADQMEQRYGADNWPGNPERIRAFAAETLSRLGEE